MMKPRIPVGSTEDGEGTPQLPSDACFHNQRFWMKCTIVKCSVFYGLSNRTAIPWHSLQKLGLGRTTKRRAA
jgi:hypothetical protein